MDSVEDVACYLQITATLSEMLSDKCLRASRGVINSKEVLAALAGEHGAAYDYVCSYDYVSDIVRILDDRIRQAVVMLDAITEREFEKKGAE